MQEIDITNLSIIELRLYKTQILDKLKTYQRLARKIDKEIKRKLKEGATNEISNQSNKSTAGSN